MKRNLNIYTNPVFFLIVCGVLFVVSGGLFPGCWVTQPDETVRAAQNAGFTDVKAGNSSFFACSESDKQGRTFTAKNANGQTVSGVVCGNLKGCTVRF